MNLNIDSVVASQSVVEDYKRYLRSLLPIADADLSFALTKTVYESKTLTKGPYLEATPAFVRSHTLEDLIVEGVLPETFRIFDSPSLPLDRPLYSHQVAAIRKVRSGRNVLVSTGTGSGKTESFLIPILASLADELQKGPLKPGVRALLLYPMNALANDQMKRLRQILKEVPDVTFGRYVGDTKQTKKLAEDNFIAQNPGEDRLVNELISRDEMQDSPPHFLLTNYAMLEYLLLRPADMDLFEGKHARSWQFLVVDEAHTYDGSRGSEFAMLLRRLKQRVLPEKELQFIATSATVGAKENPKKVIDFASNLFGGNFEWLDEDSRIQDLVTSQHKPISNDSWINLHPSDFENLLKSESMLDYLVNTAKFTNIKEADAFQILERETNMIQVRSWLLKEPKTIEEILDRLGSEWTRKDLSNLVEVGSRVRDLNGVPLLSARYHLWLRASEGAFACLSETPHVHLSRQEICTICSLPAFEFGCCTRCGVTYIVGTEIQEGSLVKLSSRLSHSDEPTWVALDNESTTEDEDDDLWDDDVPEVKDAIAICVSCGVMNSGNNLKCMDCSSSNLRHGRVVKSKSRVLKGCVACGSRTPGQVRLLDAGSDASAAVIATSLYQRIPNDQSKAGELPGKGRKLLVFSDSRQSAAYFAPYLEGTYQRLLERRMIWSGLNSVFSETERPVSFKRLVNQILISANSRRIFERSMDEDDREAEVNLWLSRELVAFDHRQSLEGLGMLDCSIYFPDDFTFPEGFFSTNLNKEELQVLITVLLTFTRKQMGISFPTGVNPADEIFAPRLGPIGISEGSNQKKVINWSPRQGSNTRLDFLKRVLSATKSELDPKLLLQKIWELLVNSEGLYLSTFRDSTNSALWQINHAAIRFRPVLEGDSIYKCDTCGSYSVRSLRSVCPTMRCPGNLISEVIGSDKSDPSHYRHVYRTLDPIPVKVQEHTAQWQASEAAEIQNSFINGKTNILSCSTTFELGVDVGELQTVFLKNIPPTTANYVQRAGRAGRRNASAALVISYAQRRSHDLARFIEPKSTIHGIVRPPIVPLGNHRIDRRHAHSIALSQFFRDMFTTRNLRWSNVGDFFAPSNDEPKPLDLLEEYLNPVPESITSALTEVMADKVLKALDMKTNAWVKAMCAQLRDVESEVEQDLAYFQEAESDASQRNSYKEAAMMQGVTRTLRSRNLLGYLGSKNILPKYGFPVDVVELRTQNASNGVGGKLELNRDLASAVYEYAPGNQIVAGGWLWESAGLYRLPKRELVRGFYSQCKGCQHFYYSLNQSDIPPICEECQNPLSIKRYLIPEYGFVAERKPVKPSSTPPERSWNGDTFFVNSDQPLHLIDERVSQSGVKWSISRGEQQRLMSVSTGLGGAGFNICDNCGRGFPAALGNPPAKHRSPWNDSECKGRTTLASLVHQYETDVLSLDLNVFDRDLAKYWSLLYAITEGAAESLQMSRDDINGTLSFSHGKISIILFDTVPGGAGCVLQIGNDFNAILEEALRKIEGCECGEETSCYSCLRTYRNQIRHDKLSRKGALDLLRDLRV